MVAAATAVLVPVRLETRFVRPGESARDAGRPDPHAPTTWRVRVRVVPDEISIDRHDPYVHDAEVAALEVAWEALAARPDPDDPAGSAARAAADPGWPDAFARLAARVGPGRAAWLVRTVPVALAADGRPRADPRTADPDRAGAGVVRGLPGRLDVWVTWADAVDRPEVLARLRPRPRLVGAPLRPTSSGWVLGWTAAVRAGMAIELSLGDRRPDEIAVLGVSGLGPGDDTTPAALLQAHADAGRLGLLAPGRPTSTVHGGPVAERGDTARSWRSPSGDHGATTTLRALAGPTATIGPVLVDDALAEHEEIAELVVGATFPALFGYGLAAVLGVVRPGEVGALWEFARGHLRPEGTHATVRVGGQAYGVLPVVDPAAVAAHAGPRLAGAVPVLDLLARLLPHLARAAEADGGVVGGGVDDAVRTLRRGPVPGLVGSRRLVPVELTAALTGQDVRDAVGRWRDEHRPTLAALGDDVDTAVADPFEGPPARAYRTRTANDWRLRLPLLGPTLDDPHTAPARDAQDAIIAHLHRLLDAAERVEVGDGRSPPLAVGVVETAFVDSLLVRLHARSLAVAGALLDIARVERLDVDGARQPSDPPPDLLEGLVPAGGRPLGRWHLEALVASGMAVADFLAPDDPLVTALRWLEEEATHRLVHVVDRADDADVRRRVPRALRATLDAASGRWDAWYPAVAAAHLADAHDRGAAPTLGAYGWVDAPFRGTPGPGPGGLLLAPSEEHAATAAVLRDRAVRDAEPGRWAMAHDSATVGPARRLLDDLARGWHLAERTGRMVERALRDRDPAREQGARLAELAALRAAFPLRVGQGAFGCCHGLDVLAALRDGALAAAAWASPGLVAAAEEVATVVDVAADLLLAGAVHDLLAGRPEAAGAASEALAGQQPPPPSRLLDPTRGGRGVHTTVLAAFPTRPDDDGAGTRGAAATAAPGLDAALTNGLGGAAALDLGVPVADGGTTTVTLTELGLGPLDAACLDADEIAALARLAARARGAVPGAGDVEVPAAHAVARRLVTAVRGRTADVDDLRPLDPATGPPTDVLAAARAAAVGVLAARTDRLVVRADDLADRLAAAARDGTEDLASHRREELEAADQGREPVHAPQTGPAVEELADLVVELAGWGIGPPPGVADLLDTPPTDAARALVLTHLERGAATVRTRLVEAARWRVPGAAPDGQAEDAASASSALGGALRSLAGAPELPVGAPLAAGLLGRALAPSAGTALADDWLHRMAAVRPRVAELAAAVGHGDLLLHGHDVADPWCLRALAPDAGGAPAPSPRLVVVATPAATAMDGPLEWVVVDQFAEHVPDARSALGLAFDAATPGAAPPAAVLVAPAADPDVGVTADDLPSTVLLARRLAHARMLERDGLVAAGLGPLGAFAVLPQDGDVGCPLAPADAVVRESRWDDVAVLLPRTARDDVADVVGAVTADAAWMLGVQWRLGEHAGEDAASPVRLRVRTSEAAIGGGADRVPIEALVETPSSTAGWDAAELHHAAVLPAGDVVLDIGPHGAGPLDWWAVRASDVPRHARPRTVGVVPGRLRWPGAPRSRHWQLDDPRRDPAGRGPDTAHPAVLHLVDLLTRHGDDWYLAPLPASTGTVARPTRVTLFDAAGGRWLLRSAPDWRLFAVAGLDDRPPTSAADDDEARWHRGLPVFATAGTALAGPPDEEVGLAVDEDANLLWAAVLRRDGAEVVRDVPAPPRPDAAAGADLDVTWRIAQEPDLDRVPYLYGLTYDTAFGAGRDLFVQAARRDPGTGALLPPPDAALLAPPARARPAVHVIEPLSVPSGGLRLVRRPMLARDVDGRPVTWWRHERLPLDVGLDVRWTWDPLTPAPTP